MPVQGMTKKGLRMYEAVKRSGSSYAPSAVVYAAAKRRPGTGLVKAAWAKRHGYPSPVGGGDGNYFMEVGEIFDPGQRGALSLSAEELAKLPPQVRLEYLMRYHEVVAARHNVFWTAVAAAVPLLALLGFRGLFK